MGAAAQATIPGVYAWGVTVAPDVIFRTTWRPSTASAWWWTTASIVSKLAAVAAVAALVAGLVLERRDGWGPRARLVSLWGFVLSCAIAWAAAPSTVLPLRIDTPRGIAGMLGWALFAFVSAAPALEGRREAERVMEEEPLPARKRLSGGDTLYVAVGALFAAALQLVGWRVAGPERALLVRFISLAAGVAIVGAATQIALARHGLRTVRSTRRRIRGAMVPIVAVGILLLTGLLFALRD
jgi:hypothetical protein